MVPVKKSLECLEISGNGTTRNSGITGYVGTDVNAQWTINGRWVEPMLIEIYAVSWEPDGS